MSNLIRIEIVGRCTISSFIIIEIWIRVNALLSVTSRALKAKKSYNRYKSMSATNPLKCSNCLMPAPTKNSKRVDMIVWLEANHPDKISEQDKGRRRKGGLNKEGLFAIIEPLKPLKPLKPKKEKPAKDGRRTAKADEDVRVQWICDEINNRTSHGREFIDTHKELFGKDIVLATKQGSRSHHYDLTLHYSDGTSRTCEEKGSEKTNVDLSTSKTPWDQSCQRFNGLGNKFEIGREYAILWYKTVVMNEELQGDFDNPHERPSQDEWLKKDAFALSPGTDYGRHLKQSYREKCPGGSMNGKKTSPHDCREDVNQLFIDEFTASNKEVLIKEVQSVLDKTMDEKDCWLQTSGKINENISFRWWDKIKSPLIKDVTLTWALGADIYFHFSGEDESHNFKCKLRFGRGTGFSNIRFDIC